MIEHILFASIKSEHQQILAELEKISRSPSVQGLEWCKSAIEEEHHTKEEIILFKPMLKEERVKQGGPMCGLYFDFFQMNRPEEFLKAKSLDFKPTPKQEIFFKESHPLQVPVSEHIASRIFLDNLISNFSSNSIETNNKLFSEYLHLNKDHFKKEDNCFLKMAEMILPNSTLDGMYNIWLSSTHMFSH